MNLEKSDNKITPVLLVKALYDFDSKDTSSLSFKKNDIIQVLTQLESGWWDGLCNGERGWFPSNYVTEFNDDNELWIPQPAPDGDVFYYNVKTGESSWEVPMDDNESSATARDTISGISSFSNQLPENWIQKRTEDGNTYYYYNVITKETRWTRPGGSISTNISDTDDGELDSHDTTLVNELEGVDTVDKASIASSKGSQLSTASVDTIQKRNLQQRQSIDNLPPNWGIKTTSQGRVYYYNRLTNEVTWNLDDINANGQLLKTENNGRSESDDNVPNEPLSPTSTVVMPYTPERFSGSSILMLQNSNEHLTWDSLSQSIDLSIHNLIAAIQENARQDYPDCVNIIIGNVRIMLYASGIEKNSIAIKQNKNLKTYHRNIMASLSKLVLSTKVAASIWPPPDAVQKMKIDSDEVLDAVHKFIQIAQQTVDIRRVDPRIIESVTGGSWHGNNLIQTNDSTSNITTYLNYSYNLKLDLINLLDKVSRSVTQSIVLLLNYVRKVIDVSNFFISTSSSPQLISQAREVLIQVGQFLFIIENINLKEIDVSNLDTINEFNVAKQALYNNIAGLVIYIQTATDPLSPLDAIDQILVSANVVDKSVKDIITTLKFLVVRTQGSRHPSAVETSSNNDNSLDQIDQIDQINGNDPKDFIENPSPLDLTNPSVPTSLQAVPENGIMINEDKTISGSDLNSNNKDDDPIPPNPASENTNRLQRSNTQSSTLVDNSSSSLIVSGGNTEAKLRAKVKKFFGEDVSPNITPQKQKEVKPWFLNYDYDQSEMVFNMEGSVKGGTLNALIERLTMHDLLDSNFIATFLLTYRSFCSTDDFFDMLVKRFMIQPPEGLTPEELEVWQEKKQTPVRLRVFNIMKTWLELYYIDDEDLHCLEKMREFARTTMHEHMAFAAVSLTKVIEKRQQQRKDAKFRELVATNSLPPPTPILPKNLKKLKFLDIDPLEIARQLTILESKLYNKIKPVECLGKAWSQSEGNDIAVNIKAMIENSNKITGWVAESVLNQKEIRKRCLYIKHFVAIADKCRSLNNFNSFTAITSGLYSAPIHRLRRTWEMVNARAAQTLEYLSKIMNSTKNFAEYREMLHSINPPCVPFFGLYLTDLTFIEDGNPDFLKNSNQLINFSKRMKTADVIREIQQYQSVPYNLFPVQEIQNFINNNLEESKDVKDLYELSLSLEPR
ncbi:ras guanine nucleotide exchange factor domain-containing protein [Glomus cerebriforme]|nr:ras guanine nucleotide exchange factor domain-containing protein [Glomus cerebriforme]